MTMDDTHHSHLAEMLDLLPERVVRYRVADHVIVSCNAS